jgi:hypothetical protein
MRLLAAFCVAALPVFAAPINTTIIEIPKPGAAVEAHFGNSVASIPDVNGDGVSDLAIGAPEIDRVYVLSGADRSVIHDIGDPESASGNLFGWVVIAAGDVNGDGVGDIGVGARGVDGLVPIPCPLPPDQCPPPSPASGRAFLISGQSGTMIRKLLPTAGIEFFQFGFDLASLGDVNGDSVPDIAVGAPTRLNNRFGQTFAFSGATGAMLWVTATAPEELASFGSSLASVSDLNSDGRRDLIVGEPFYSEGPAFIGRAHVLSGSTGSIIRVHLHPLGNSGDIFSLVSAAIGDQNGDGREDYAISDPGISSVFVFSGANGAELGTLDSPASSTTDFFGFDLTSSDDRNGDGKREIWAGAPGGGKVYLLTATETLLLTINDPTAGAPPPALGFGWSLSSTGNLGGDAKSDLLIGEPSHSSNTGRAYLALLQENRPPVADAGDDQTVECTGSGSSSVTLDGSGSSDPDGDTLTYTWRDSSNTVVGSTASVTLSLPLGTHVFTLTVSDGFGGSSSDSVSVVVDDTTAPTITVSLSPDALKPPNHKLIPITATITATDGCGAVVVTLVSITSNEPDDGLGDGDTPNDIQEAALGTDDRAFLLRAERAGGGGGRIYTVVYSAVDGSGNSATASAVVVVP